MSRVKRVVAKDEQPVHGCIDRRSRSSMKGKRFGKLVVGDLVKLPSDRLCHDCGYCEDCGHAEDCGDDPR